MATADKNSSFRKIIEAIPLSNLLTETDSPYMGPFKGEINDPSTVPMTIATMADIKQISVEEAKATIRNNFRNLFLL